MFWLRFWLISLPNLTRLVESWGTFYYGRWLRWDPDVASLFVHRHLWRILRVTVIRVAVEKFRSQTSMGANWGWPYTWGRCLGVDCILRTSKILSLQKLHCFLILLPRILTTLVALSVTSVCASSNLVLILGTWSIAHILDGLQWHLVSTKVWKSIIWLESWSPLGGYRNRDYDDLIGIPFFFLWKWRRRQKRWKNVVWYVRGFTMTSSVTVLLS